MIYAGKEIKTILIGNRVLTSAYVGSVNVYVSAKPFSECTWAEIKEIADAGLASQYFALGDTKTDTDTNNVTHTYRIVQFGYGGNALLLEELNPLRGAAVWNQSSNVDDDGDANNYSISDMRTTVLPAILITYPSALRSVINETSYIVSKNGTAGTIETLQDKLFLGAEKEYFGIRTWSVQQEADALTQFALYAENNTADFRKKEYSYWERSQQTNVGTHACVITASGTADAFGTSNSYKFSPLFAIGDYATRTIPYVGNSTLTASYVSTWASKIQASVRAGCTKVIVPAEFTAIEAGALDGIDVFFPNINTLETNCRHNISIYSAWAQTGYTGKIKKLIYNASGVPAFTYSDAYIDTMIANNIVGSLAAFSFNDAKPKSLYLGGITEFSLNQCAYRWECEKMYLLQNVVSFKEGNPRNPTSKQYVNALYISSMLGLAYPPSKPIGVIDGAGVYTDKGFAYPTLSATLTIDANGHLIENGVDLFTGYTATWYSDEDCTTVIADPTTITSSMTAYVKLTAI